MDRHQLLKRLDKAWRDFQNSQRDCFAALSGVDESKSRNFSRLVVNRYQGEIRMKFMVTLKSNKTTEAGIMPTEKVLTEMGRFNEEWNLPKPMKLPPT